VARKRTSLLKAMSAKHTGKSKFTDYNGYRRLEKNACTATTKRKNQLIA
jgi:hypothetical protein